MEIKKTIVKDMRGASISTQSNAISLQFEDDGSVLHQLDMSLGNAMYLLSLLKSIQLSQDIPFPDDPRDPNAIAVRPSERNAHRPGRK